MGRKNKEGAIGSPNLSICAFFVALKKRQSGLKRSGRVRRSPNLKPREGPHIGEMRGPSYWDMHRAKGVGCLVQRYVKYAHDILKRKTSYTRKERFDGNIRDRSGNGSAQRRKYEH